MLVPLTTALVLLALRARADVSWGSADSTTYQMQYDTATYGTGAAGSLNFCQTWRLACIGFVGPKDYHHQVNCGATEPGPIIFNECLAVLKQADGDYGNGPPCDYTADIMSRVSGVTIVSNPTSPVITCEAQQASGDTMASSIPAGTTTSPAVVGTTTTSTTPTPGALIATTPSDSSSPGATTSSSSSSSTTSASFASEFADSTSDSVVVATTELTTSLGQPAGVPAGATTTGSLTSSDGDLAESSSSAGFSDRFVSTTGALLGLVGLAGALLA